MLVISVDPGQTKEWASGDFIHSVDFRNFRQGNELLSLKICCPTYQSLFGNRVYSKRKEFAPIRTLIS